MLTAYVLTTKAPLRKSQLVINPRHTTSGRDRFIIKTTRSLCSKPTQRSQQPFLARFPKLFLSLPRCFILAALLVQPLTRMDSAKFYFKFLSQFANSISHYFCSQLFLYQPILLEQQYSASFDDSMRFTIKRLTITGNNTAIFTLAKTTLFFSHRIHFWYYTFTTE